MDIDLRLPLGLLFALIGALMLAYGFIAPAAIYDRSLGINVNRDWGAVLFVFGGAMLLWARLNRLTPRGPRPPEV